MLVIGEINVRFCICKLLGRKVDDSTSTAFSVPAITNEKFYKVYSNIYGLAIMPVIQPLEYTDLWC